jgi:glycosyltransferase involved in cell wall biosynthesis
LRILLVEPYDTGSHAVWMRGYQAHSAFDVRILSLEGQFWQWRMLGGAVTLAERFMALEHLPDLIVAADMLDLTAFLALTRPITANLPVALYFHENQLTYPTGPRQKLQQHYAFINYASALAADAIFFNSAFHRDAFFEELPRLLKHYPDHVPLHTMEPLRERSSVLPVGLDLQRYDTYRPHGQKPSATCSGGSADRTPLIIWNHRWEYDKNPGAFFKALYALADEGLPFEVALVGENTRQNPAEFENARDRLGSRVVHYGYMDSFADYARLLWQANVVVSTSKQDFFGISVVEAIYCGCWPVLADRLNFPALVPEQWHSETLFKSSSTLIRRLRARLTDPRPAPSELRAHVAAFDWRRLAPQYDAAFARVANRPR